MEKQISKATPDHGSEIDYWRHSSQPLVSLAFVAPLLMLYESGAIWLGAGGGRSGADLWLRGTLERAGFAHPLLLPVLVCGLLLAAHHWRRHAWNVAAGVLSCMWLEAAAWGAGLFLIAKLALLPADGYAPAAATIAQLSPHALGNHLVAYLGAGIYEELLFRLLLVPPAIGLLRAARFRRAASIGTAVIVTSLIFAAAHYRFEITAWGFTWPHGESFSALSFIFRFAGGAALALLFAYRGFGIAVGAHAFYDLLLTLV
jgi:membrane protease YdiL (CAAX protease family)